ncbi:MAG: helix-turn-helix domain-containing protein [Muribaculaceae bacterium]|nr:helix-turn-helix domain-containing protein [Muribaculaceae bacterium]
MKTIPTIHIGEEIKCRFDKSGLTQKEFGSRIGMPQQNVCRVFNGESIDTKRLVAISRALNFNFFELYCNMEHREVHTEGDYSPASDSGNVSVTVGDAVLAERVKLLEQIIDEKDARIEEYKERISELKGK